MLDDAITTYKKALQLKLNLTEIHKNLGNTLQEQKTLEAAITSYTKALEIDPNDAETHHQLGISLARTTSA